MANKKPQPPIDLANRLTLTMDEAASVLGVSKRHLANNRSEIPVIYFGSKPLVPVNPLREWIKRRAASEAAETAAAAQSILDSFRKAD